MSQSVQIPTPLRRFTDEAAEVTVDGATVAAALEDLVTRHPELRGHLFTEGGELRSFVNVFVGDDNVRDLDGVSTPLDDGQRLLIIPSIAGGAPAGVAPEVAPGAPGAPDTPGDLLEGRPLPALSAEEVQRYSRHLIMPEVAMEGQTRLKASRVLMVGAGGLGSPLGLYLAAAGVGTIGIVDFDTVDVSNLHRQVLYGASDVGRPKLEAAIDRLHEVNPHVDLVPHEARLSSDNALALFEGYDLVVDGTDNFPTRYLVNDACVLTGKPNVYGSIFRFEGQVSVFWGAEGPCYRCLFAEPPPPGLVPSCAEGGVLGVLPGIIGALQANEVVKLLLGTGDPLIGRLLLFDALGMKFRELKLKKDPSCPVCSAEPTITELIDYEEFCGIPGTGADATDHAPAANDDTGEGAGDWADALPFEIRPHQLADWLDADDAPFVLDVRNPPEWQICHLDVAKMVPLPELPKRLDEVREMADGRTIVAHCHHGMRSAKAVHILRQAGLPAINLGGGIDAWSEEVDPRVARY
jgi:adenylyltransferase/sulfurtransferase